MAELACPACGTDVSISLDVTCVTVCPSCLKVLERSDVGLVDRGVLAPLRETRSKLRVNLRGRYDKRFFTVCGRVQVTESGGNLWDEWYAAFDGGQWGWLAEDRGRIFLSTVLEHPGEVPAFDAVRPGKVLTFAGRRYTVSEVDVGQVVAAEGELPFFFRPNESMPFADLSGQDGSFGTIDYTFEPPRVYLGRELPVDAFRLDRDIDTRIEGDSQEPPAPAPLADPTCPACQKSFVLRTPGQTVRAVCPHCSTLSDVEGRMLKVVRKVESTPPKGPRMWVPMGATGTLRGEKLTVVAWRLRSVTKEGTRYPWQETLLYGSKGYRNLDCADGHFTLGQAVAAGEVNASATDARFRGQKFERFSVGHPVLEALAGEWPWRVDPQERSHVAEYTRPPMLLACEEGAGELEWTLSESIPAAEVAQAFPTGKLPTEVGVGAAERYRHAGVFKVWRWAMLVLMVGWAVRWVSASPRLVVDSVVALPAPPPAGAPGTFTVTNRLEAKPSESFPLPEAGQPLTVTSEEFELKGGQVIKAKIQATVDNAWVFAAAELLNEETGDLQPFSLEIARYHGVDGGESWSEGDQANSTRVSAMPEGLSRLRLGIDRDPGDRKPVEMTIQLIENSPSGIYLLLAMLLISLLPLFAWIGKAAHERRRWENSDFPKHTSEE